MTKDIDPRLRHLFWFVAELFAALLSAVALLLIVVRLALPHAAIFKPHLEVWFSHALGETVRIGEVSAHWPGLDMAVVLNDVALLDARGEPRAEFDRAYVSIDPMRSLLRGKPVLHALHLDGLQVSLFGDIFAANTAPAPPRADAQAVQLGDDFGWFLPWLFTQRQIDITSGRLLWYDPVSEQPQANGFSLRSRNEGGHHSLAAHIDTRSGDGVIDLAAEIDGAAGAPAEWGGSLYLRGRRVQWRGVVLLAEQASPGSTAGLLPLDAELGLPGITDFELWGELREGQLRRVAGEAAVSAPSEHQQHGVARVATRFDWRPVDAGWEVAVDGVEVEPVDGGRFRTGPAAVRYTGGSDGPLVEAGLAWVDVGVLRQLALAGSWLGEESATRLDALAPSGQFYDLRGVWRGGADARETDWRVVGELWDARLNPWQAWPGVQGVRVAFDVGPRGGRGTLFGRDTVVSLPRLFREPLIGERVSGALQLLREPEGWRLRSEALEIDTAHIHTVTRLDALLPDGGEAPFLDLEVGYRDGEVAEVWRYLPVGIMPAGVVTWLEHALVDGRVVGGGMVLHGPLDRFPFDAHDGRFQVRFEVEEMTLDYLEGWPRIEGLGAWTTFDGRGMHIAAHTGRILGAELGPTDAVTRDLTAKNSHLHVEGKVTGDAEAGLSYLRESPLRARFGDYLAVAKAGGRLDLGLGLDIVLATGETRVDGTIDLADATLDLPAYGIVLHNSHGRLAFDNASLVGDGLAAEWRGMATEVDVRVPDDPAAGRNGPRIAARGRAGAAQFAELLPAPLAARLAGELPWEVVVGVNESANGRVDGVVIRATSDLAGLAVDLPSPLGKPAGRRLPLRVEALLPADAAPRLDADYGPLSLVAELQRGESGVTLPRAALALDAGPATLPEASGWKIALGGTPPDLDGWRAVAGELAATAGPAHAGPPVEVVARFDRLPLGETLALHEVDARLETDGDAWQVALRSREAVGRFRLPRGGGREVPVTGHLERMNLAYDRDPARRPDPEPDRAPPDPGDPDPRTLPGLQLEVDALVVNGVGLGALTVQADPTAEGLRIAQIVLDAPDWILTGIGRWESGAEGIATTLDLALDTTQVSRLVTAILGPGDLVADEGHFSANLTWPGAPQHVSLATLDGSLTLRLVNGTLTEVDPGLGRLFSLVNLRTLGRRLALDFSDLVDKGTQFDAISGRFVFSGGDAFTNDLLIETSGATINLMGRTGLVARDYDQVMTVLPQASGALPLAGTLLGGPAVGAVLLLFNEVFSEQIEEISRVQYRVSGPWDKPHMERIGSEPSEPQTDTLPQAGGR